MTSAETTTDKEALSPLHGLPRRLFFLTAAGFLLLGLALYGVAAFQLVQPETFAGTAELSYGRIYPAGLNAILFGWLTIGLLGVAFHSVPRMSGTAPINPLASLGVLGLAAAGTAGGIVMILLGDSAGGRWLEFPLVADGALALAYLGAAILITRSARGGRGLPVGGRYLVAAPWWLFLTYVVGAIPGIDGLPAEVQSDFTATALFGLWAIAAAVGGAYYAVSRALPEAEFHPRLGTIGFWSLGLAWGWTAGRLLQYGPTGDWAETLPVVFGAIVAVAAITIVADFASALRGRWDEIRSSVPMHFVLGGLFFLIASTLTAFVASFRSASSVLQFTPWESGYEQAALFGAATMLGMAAVASALTAATGKAWGWFGRTGAGLVFTGVAVSVASRLIGGLQQGYSWLAGVQARESLGAGPGFEQSSAPLEGLNWLQVAGLGLLGLGALLFVVRVLALVAAKQTATEPAEGAEDDAGETIGLVRNAFALFLLAAVGAFVLPAFDANDDPTLYADTTGNLGEGTVAATGRDLYVSEGCWYCHTQQVRAVVTDVGLGPVSVSGDYAYDPNGLAGLARVGPDLTHVASRPDTDSAEWLRQHLVDPRSARPWSTMPSYDYLSSDEVTAIAAYLAGLK